MTTQTSAQTGDQSVPGRASEVKDRAADVGGTVQDKAGEVAGTAQSRAVDVAGTAKDQAAEVAQEAQRQARDLLGEFRGQLQQQTQAQRDRLVEMLRDFEDELQNMVQSGGRGGTASEVARQVADRLAGFRSYLEGGANPLDDVRSFARRRPGTFLFLAAAAGVLAGRATRGAAAARKQQQSGGRHVIDVRDGQIPSSYTSGYDTGYTSGTATGYTTGTSAGYAAGSTGGYTTGDYGQTGATGYPVTGETTTTYTTGGAEGYRDQYGEQYGAGGTAEGEPTYGLERTSDPNLAPTSGALTGDTLTDRDLGVPDEPVAPEYGGEGVGQPGPNAPTGSTESSGEYTSGTDSGTGPTYGEGSEERSR
jgi:hypothetical protein